MTEALDRVPPASTVQATRAKLTLGAGGGGAGGVELAAKMADLLRDAVKRRALHGEPRVLVIELADRLVPGMGQEIRGYVEDALEASRVEVHTETSVVKVTAGGIMLEHQNAHTEIETAAVVWVAGVRVNPLVDQLAVQKDRRGLIIVDPTLQVRGHENVFALGDIAFYQDVVPTLAGTAPLSFPPTSLLAPACQAF